MNEEILNAILNELNVITDVKSIQELLESHPKYAEMNGDPTEKIEIIMEDFPKLFDHIDEPLPVYKNDISHQKAKYVSKYNPGSKKHNNGNGKMGGASRQKGIERAKERHQVKKFEGIERL